MTQLEWLPLVNAECFFIKTQSSILNYTKNEVSNTWEFMILDLPKSNLGPLSIDSDLKCLSVHDKADQTLKTYDTRKFKLISEFKLSHDVSSFLV